MLIRTELKTTDDQLVTLPGADAVVHAAYFANTTSALRRIRVHHLLSGETSGTRNALFYDVAIPGNSTYVDDTRIAIQRGEELRGMADGSGVVATFYLMRVQ